MSDGLYQVLVRKIEDLLALRSDSSYIAYRLVDEAMKRNTVGDITALVVQVEKLTISSGSGKRPALRTQTRHNVRTRVDKLNKAPAITYKYNRRNANKYQSTVLIGMVIVSVVVLFGILFLMISSLMNTGREDAHNNTPTTAARRHQRCLPETDLPTEEPDKHGSRKLLNLLLANPSI